MTAVRLVLGARSKGNSFLGTFCASSKMPSAAVNIEFHDALVSHFQQEGLASFLVQDIGSSHDLTNLERLFTQSAQDIVSIIQHAFSLTITSDSTLLTVRKLIFRHYTLYLVRLDAVSKTSVRLDRHTLNDGVNLWRLDLHPPLRSLTAMKDFVVWLVSM
jgi:hypothetical protein